MVELQDIVKSYQTRFGAYTVLNRVNLTVNPGDRLGILGRNGAGKSTLIRIVSGQEIPDNGTVSRTMKVSWPLAFSGGFQGSLTGLDNLRFISRIYNVDHAKIQDYVENFAELGKHFREPVRNYSSGMQARLAFALSLAIEFDCYLIDEIIAVGDARFHRKCTEELFERRKDRAFFIVSHDANFIKSYCTKAAILEKGHLTYFNDVNQAYAEYMAPAA